MSFFIVVHHPKDEQQPRLNEWLDEDRLGSIHTTAEIAERCAVAKRRGERVYIHRRRWLEELSTICCSVRVKVAESDGDKGRVEFKDQEVLGTKPPILPVKGQETYGSA